MRSNYIFTHPHPPPHPRADKLPHFISLHVYHSRTPDILGGILRDSLGTLVPLMRGMGTAWACCGCEAACDTGGAIPKKLRFAASATKAI